MIFEIRSGLISPMRFGTSSPISIETRVTIMTTMVRASDLAIDTETPVTISIEATPSAIPDPVNTPVRMPISVTAI